MKSSFHPMRCRRGAVVGVVLAATLAAILHRADAQSTVATTRFGEALAARLGYEALFIPEPPRSERLQQFLAGERERALPAQSFLSASPALRLTSDEAEHGKPPRLAVESAAASGEAEYRFYLVRAGAVAVLARARGGPQLWQLDEGGPVPLLVGNEWSEMEMPQVWLEPGEHRLRITLPPNGAISSLRLSLPCVSEILPADLLDSDQPLSFHQKTVAMLRALGREDMLPPADEAQIIVGADQFASVGPTLRLRLDGGVEGEGFLEAAGQKGVASFKLEIKREGVYVVRATLAGGGASSWNVNGCRVASMPTLNDIGDSFQVRRIAAIRLDKGEQRIDVVLRPGVRLSQLSLQRADDNPSAYAEAARQLGLAEGDPTAQVTEGALHANLSYPGLDERRREFRDMDRDRGDAPDLPPSLAFAPVPDELPEEFLPSDEVEPPYDQPASPFLPLPTTGL